MLLKWICSANKKYSPPQMFYSFFKFFLLFYFFIDQSSSSTCAGGFLFKKCQNTPFESQTLFPQKREMKKKYMN